MMNHATHHTYTEHTLNVHAHSETFKELARYIRSRNYRAFLRRDEEEGKKNKSGKRKLHMKDQVCFLKES